jgi:hypothetical protein
MRDLTVSSLRWSRYASESMSYNVQGLSSPITFATSTVTPLALDPAVSASFRQVFDPDALMFQGPWSYYGTQPDWSVFGLPPGLWFGEAFITFVHNSNFTGKRYLSVAIEEETWEIGGSPESYFGDPNYFNPVLGSFNTQHQASSVLTQGSQSRVDASGMIWIPETGTVPTGRTAVNVWAYQNSGVGMTITDFGVNFRRVF